MWLSLNSKQRKKTNYFVPRYLEREFGFEYLKCEWKKICEFSNAKKNELVEINGYVSWLNNKQFVLLPTPTTWTSYIVCELDSEVPLPSTNQHIAIKGKWIHRVTQNEKAEKILLVEDMHELPNDFRDIKPDIDVKEFNGLLFENWSNIEDSTKQLISQAFVSSPTILSRSGGITLTLTNFTKQFTMMQFSNDLRRSIPKELSSNKPLSFKISETNTNHKLKPFGWSDYVAPSVTTNEDINTKLERNPTSNDEYSITLLQKNGSLIDFNQTSLIKSDYPILLEQSVERKRKSFDANNEIFKFILATHFHSPEMSPEVYKKSSILCREKLVKFSKNNELFKGFLGHKQFLDLGQRGKPLSIQTLSTSIGRANLTKKLNLDDIEKSYKIYQKNLEYIMYIQNDFTTTQLPPNASLNIDQNQVYKFFVDKGPSSITDCAIQLKIKNDQIEKIVSSLLTKSLLYDLGNGTFNAVP